MTINLKRSLYVGLAALMVASTGISSINNVNANASRRRTRSSRVTHVRRHRSRRHARRRTRRSKRTRKSHKNKSKRSSLLVQMKNRANKSQSNANLKISHYIPGLSKSTNNKVQKYLKAHPRATLLDALNKVTPLKQKNTKSKRSALAKKTNDANTLAKIGFDVQLLNNSAFKNTNRNRNKVLRYMQKNHVNNTENAVSTVFTNSFNLKGTSKRTRKNTKKRSSRSVLRNRISRNENKLNSANRSKRNLGKLIALGGFKGINKSTQKKLTNYLMAHPKTLNKLSNRKAAKSAVRSALTKVNEQAGSQAKKSIVNAVNNLKAMNNPQATKYAEQIENSLNTTLSVQKKNTNNAQSSASFNHPIISFSNGDGTTSTYDN